MEGHAEVDWIEDIGDRDLPFVVLKPVSTLLQRNNQYFPYKCEQPLLSYHSSDLARRVNTWNNTETANLIEAVQQLPHPINWSLIGEQLGRQGRECFRHYHTTASPELNKLDWTEEEEKNLIKICEELNYRNWELISEKLGTNRSAFECLRHYQQALNSDLVNSTAWTEEEDSLLKSAVEEYGVGRWQQVSNAIPGRSAIQANNRWKISQACNDSIVSGHWLEREERELFLSCIAHEAPMLADTKRTDEERDMLLAGKFVLIDL
jgi:hypothetical protein